jgi:chromate transporter
MRQTGKAAEVFWVFLQLGLTSFGGPVAHLGYFRRAFVEKQRWMSAADYAGLVGFCQVLPGPASSQTGFCIGLMRAGWLGGLAAWLGFTLPSALLMFAIAGWVDVFDRSVLSRHILHGLQLAAVAVVAQAVWVMARSLCPDMLRRALALLAMAILIVVPDTAGQISVLLIGALFGRLIPAPVANVQHMAMTQFVSRNMAYGCIGVFTVLLALSFIPAGHDYAGLFAAFYRTGALVFGGGHVVLPLLHDAVVAPGWVAPHLFLGGYGAAQAMPGPLFTVAAFLGAVAGTGSHAAGAAVALAAIFLPGLLLAAGLLPFWDGIRQKPGLAAALSGVNAAVVGLLGYALLSLVTQSGFHSLADFVIVAAALGALVFYKTPPILVVGFCAVAAVLV